MAEVGGKVVWSDGSQGVGERLFERGDGTGLDFAELLFELCPTLLDGIEIGRVGREITESGAGVLDQLPDAVHLVGSQIVEHYQMTRVQLRAKNVLQIGQKDIPVGGGFHRHGGDPTGNADRAQHRPCSPATDGNSFPHSFASLSSTVAVRHFRRDAAFVDEDEPLRIQLPRLLAPELALRPDSCAVLCGGV
jgi:hypothetical protein